MFPGLSFSLFILSFFSFVISGNLNVTNATEDCTGRRQNGTKCNDNDEGKDFYSLHRMKRLIKPLPEQQIRKNNNDAKTTIRNVFHINAVPKIVNDLKQNKPFRDKEITAKNNKFKLQKLPVNGDEIKWFHKIHKLDRNMNKKMNRKNTVHKLKTENNKHNTETSRRRKRFIKPLPEEQLRNAVFIKHGKAKPMYVPIVEQNVNEFKNKPIAAINDKFNNTDKDKYDQTSNNLRSGFNLPSINDIYKKIKKEDIEKVITVATSLGKIINNKIKKKKKKNKKKTGPTNTKNVENKPKKKSEKQFQKHKGSVNQTDKITEMRNGPNVKNNNQNEIKHENNKKPGQIKQVSMNEEIPEINSGKKESIINPKKSKQEDKQADKDKIM